MDPKQKYDLYLSWINLLLEEGKNLTKWEEDFIDSVYEQLLDRGSISDRQAEILERIYAEKTS